MSCSRTQRCDNGEAGTRNPLISTAEPLRYQGQEEQTIKVVGRGLRFN